MLRWFLLLVGFSVFGQVDYEFDYVAIYKDHTAAVCNCSNNNDGYKYTFINSKKNTYSLRVSKTKKSYYLFFKDSKNNIQGSGTMDTLIFPKLNTIILKDWVQFDSEVNHSSGIKEYIIDSIMIDSNRTQYVLERKSKRKIRKEGILRRSYIADKRLSEKYNGDGFKALRKIFHYDKSNSVKHDLLVEHFVDSINGDKIERWKLDTIYPLTRKLILNEKSYYTPKIKH